MKITRRRLLSAAAFGSAGCGVGSRTGAAPVVRVSVPITPTAAAFYLALERGYFREAGVRVEVEEVTFAGNQAQLLAAGRIDAALMPMSPAVLSAVQRGADLKAVCGREAVSSTCPTSGEIVGRKAAFPKGLTDLRELEGKKLAFTTAGSFTEFALDAILESAGLSRERVQALALRPAESMTALAAGRIDGLVSLGSLDGVRLPPGVAVYPGLSRSHVGLVLSFLFFSGPLRRANRAAGVGFLRAYLRGAREFVAGQTPEALAMLAQKSGLDPDSIRNACRGATRADGSFDARSIDSFSQWALRKKYVDTVPPAESLMEASLLAEARA